MSRIVVNDVTSLKDAFTLFIMEKKSQGLSDATIGNYIECFGVFTKWFNEDLPTVYISEVRFIGWVNSLTCSPNSKNHWVGNIRVFLYWCMNNEFVERFPIKLVKCQEEKIKFFSESELRLLLRKPNYKNFADFRTYAIICFILATGARASTVVNIKLCDIDWERKEVTYTHLKNKKVAVIPLSNALLSVLIDYKRHYQLKEYFFCDCYTRQLSVNGLRQALTKYCLDRNVSPRGPHALRHSFARGWILNNGNAFTLQKMLTHSDLQMTKKYVRLFGSDLHKDLEEYSPLDNMIQTREYIKKR